MTLSSVIRDMERRLTAVERENAQLKRELARHEERTEGLSAQETYNRTKAYIDNNPKVWERICLDATHAVMLNERFSIAKEFEELRDSKWLEKHESEDYKCNNSYRACMTRFLVVQFPSLVTDGLVSIRKSKIDKFFPELEEVLNAA
ncbi:MAG: hypothetical protein IJ111_01490 [Eggerthellaceae bacterium]|nr:hypothetical protein [Eggerthellaceae bacterium]